MSGGSSLTVVGSDGYMEPRAHVVPFYLLAHTHAPETRLSPRRWLPWPRPWPTAPTPPSASRLIPARGPTRHRPPPTPPANIRLDASRPGPVHGQLLPHHLTMATLSPPAASLDIDRPSPTRRWASRPHPQPRLSSGSCELL
jgi:hypothetical protein